MMGKKPAGVLMFLLVILMVLGTAELQSDCRCSSSTCDCQSRGLTSVPQDLPTNTTELLLQSNQITTLSQSNFSRYGSLEILELGSNRISTINDQTFYPLSNLSSLNLAFNRIPILTPGTFTGLGNLEILNLRRNDITDIPAGTFNPTPQLITLELRNNRLGFLRAGMFAGLGNLQEASLYFNEITDIQAGTFTPTPQLRTLKLQINRLTALRADMFTGLRNLQQLWLGNNDIGDIQAGTFNPTPQLRNLFLSSNQIQSLPPYFLANLPNLTDLRLSENGLTTFPFQEMSRFQTFSLLYLRRNQLTTLPSIVYDVLSSISSVDIYTNPWQCDCRMVDFRLKMSGSYPFEDQITCSQPDSLNGLKLKDVSPEDLEMSNCEEPTIVRFMRGDNMTLYYGETLLMVCEASGIPTPDITITLPSGVNATVDSAGRVTVYVNGTVTVRNVTAADAGLYTCIAENSANFTSASATLVVDLHAVPTTVLPPVVTSPLARSFTLPVLLGSSFGSVAGALLIVAILLTIWCRRSNNQGPPEGPGVSDVLAADTDDQEQDLTGQTQAQPISPPSNVEMAEYPLSRESFV
ncbi:uncharacterized protein LOC144903784 [Branchiostoma floridae x Branchiostoma belcheri]